VASEFYVIRAFDGNRRYESGEVVEASGFRNLRKLIDQRYLRPVDPIVHLPEGGKEQNRVLRDLDEDDLSGNGLDDEEDAVSASVAAASKLQQQKTLPPRCRVAHRKPVSARRMEE